MKKVLSLKIYLLPLLFLVFTAALTARSYADIAEITRETFSFAVNQRVVLIDAGHGGWDPGKLGTVGEDEKDINLKIADNLQTYLENSGGVVLLTRNNDEALGNRKRDDLFKRKELGNTSRADVVVSIHQNAYPSRSVKGSQVFYFKTSDKSKVLAECIQKRLNTFADIGNRRIAKENGDYYMLKQTNAPAVIVECGFLSNRSDEKRLNTQQYQEKVAWAIYTGIEDYFETLEPEKGGENENGTR